MDTTAIDRATTLLLQRGIRVFNPYLLREDERAHAERLLELMDPPQGATVLDAGCGVGELARLMHEARPDLSFTLLNVSGEQLQHCPDGMQRLQGTYDAIPLADRSVDVVLFAFSLCHSADWQATLREAVRVLKPGGMVFVFDMARLPDAPANGLMRELLQADAYRVADALDVAHRAGLKLEEALGHEPARELLREVFEAPRYYDVAFDGVVPVTYRFRKMAGEAPIASAFARHERIAFQFSGGRDSMAAAWVLKPYWDRMTFYHLDTGDQFPETRQAVAAFEILLGKPIVRITTDVESIRRDHGYPSDVVPVDNTGIGRMVSGRAVKIISRYECCARALMHPMHERMVRDRITLIVRGQRDEEYSAPPKRSGDVEGGMEVLYPIQHWAASDVDTYLREHQLPVAPFYERGMRRAPECMGCTAWWDEGRAAYLREHHPAAHAEYALRMQLVRGAIERQLGQLED